MLRPSHNRFDFGPFRLDLTQRALFRDGTRVALNSRTLDLLAALVQQPGEVLEKDYLLRAVWSDAIVEEKNLTVQVAALRKVLGDDPQAPAFVATVPGRGYQFTVPVRPVYQDAPDEPAVTVVRPKRLVAASVAAAVIVMAALVYWQTMAGRSPVAPTIGSIAILPMRALIPSEQDAYLEIGMADALITRLSRLRTHVVRPTSAVRRYVAPDLDARAAGLELGVDAVLDAHLQRAGDRIRITARLVRVADGASLWADTFDEPVSNLFALEDALSDRLVTALSVPLTGGDKRRLSASISRNPEAYQAYLKGRFYWGRWTRDGMEKAIAHFNDALKMDPSFALAHAGLADAYALLGYLRMEPPRTVFPKAGEAARRALELDDTLPDAHLVLAKVLFFYDWDFPRAKVEIQRALALDPAHADAHGFFGAFLMAQGDFAGAASERKRNLDLDPLSALATNAVGWTHFYQKQYDPAIQWYQKALEIDPQFAPALNDIGQAEYLAGRMDKAINAWLSARTITGLRADERARLQRLYDEGGMRAFWLDELQRISSRAPGRDAWRTARIHYELGHTDDALASLAQAIDERDSLMVFLQVSPMFERLRSDARFRRLLTRIGPDPKTH